MCMMWALKNDAACVLCSCVPVSDIKLDDEVLLGLVAILVGPLAARGARADHHHDAVGIALGIVRIA